MTRRSSRLPARLADADPRGRMGLPDPLAVLQRSCERMQFAARANRRGRPEVFNEQVRIIGVMLERLALVMPMILEWEKLKNAREADGR